MVHDDSYNGMMVLDHTVEANGCRSVAVNCVPTTPGENATLCINDNTALISGSGSHLMKFTCNADGRWATDDGMLTESVSCLVQKRPSDVTSQPELSTPPTTTTTTTARPPGLDPCMACSPLTVVPLTSGYHNGFTTLLTSTNGKCKTIELNCEGNQPDDELVLVISGTVFEQGVGSLRTNLTCNDMSTWTTSSGYAVPLASCGIELPLCNECPNLQPAPAEISGPNEANGLLVLDHFTDLSNCRVVMIRCTADGSFENATLLFNGNIKVATAPQRISSSLTCTHQGTWSRLDQEITTTSCRVTRNADATLSPVTTTTIATTTTTLAGSVPCANCNRQLVTSVPSGYTNGFLTMDTSSSDECINVALSCSAPDGSSNVALMNSAGEELVSSASRSNLTLKCNDQAKWITPSNTVVENLSCAVAERYSIALACTREHFREYLLSSRPCSSTSEPFLKRHHLLSLECT
ncbi:hypothetical protein Q1695_002906 [Nippostrongylus brasiliensis]|nr:hypothetical protein Q1695_002906 [Nippostrongylus brasiliensis]